MATEKEFLGIGWQFPPSFSKTSTSAKTDMVSSFDNINRSLYVLLSTNLGERLMRPSFGGGLVPFMFAPIDVELITEIKSTVTDAILLYEPRIKLLDVDVNEDDAESGLLQITIEYLVRASNSRLNLVYPFYINEASIQV